jgi:hypothetical protein
MLIKVTEISAVNNIKKGKNNWQEIVVKYDGAKGPASRTVRSFPYADVFNAFKSEVKPGDNVDVTVVKEGDYWQWKEAVVTEGNSVPNNQEQKSTSAVSGVSGSTSSKTKAGDWETAAERAARQRYIVRQSSISSAIEYFNLRGNRDAGVVEIVNVAKAFEAHVFGEALPDTKAAAPKKRTTLAEIKPEQEEEEEIQ